MTEEQLLDALIGKRGLATILGWQSAHFRPAKTEKGWRTAVAGDGVGFPDLVLVKTDRTIFAECKSDKGRPSPEQVVWLDLLSQTEGAEVYLWRPADLEEIQCILTLGHSPNLIERAELSTAWVNRREA